ncbi:Hypothetical protein A7982_06041 [Minicystis rosea]|nr:Hypothetical protein A7982_06041 [Minicystis rosea]
MRTMAMRAVIANIVVGKPQVAPDAPSHTSGVREGNDPPKRWREPGIALIEGALHVTARRSTGIRPNAHGPIDPRMPVLSPA